MDTRRTTLEVLATEPFRSFGCHRDEVQRHLRRGERMRAEAMARFLDSALNGAVRLGAPRRCRWPTGGGSGRPTVP